MSDPFATLGVPRRFTLAPSELEQRHRDLSRALHPDRYVTATPSERRVALERAVAVNDAFRQLRDPLRRAEALLTLHGRAVGERDRAPPALLMEVMELREALDEARAKPAKREALRADVAAKVRACESALAATLDVERPDDRALDRARDAVASLRYYRRFEEEADAMDE